MKEGFGMDKRFVMDFLEMIQRDMPDQIFVMETSEGTTRCALGAALIYEGMRGEIVIDTE